jgi:hypothetical protein
MKKGQRTGWLKSTAWVDKPYTSYQCRREMRVRESRHTAMVFDKRYYNPDSMKFDSNKIDTIYSQALSSCMDNDYGCQDARHTQYNTHAYIHEPIFIPKDDDFDEECRRDEAAKAANLAKVKLIVKAKPKPLPKPLIEPFPAPIIKTVELTKLQWEEYRETQRKRIQQEEAYRELCNKREKERILKETQAEHERQILASTPMHFAYHPDFPARLVPTDEYNRLISEGWFDTPAKFPKLIVLS